MKVASAWLVRLIDDITRCTRSTRRPGSGSSVGIVGSTRPNSLPSQCDTGRSRRRRLVGITARRRGLSSPRYSRSAPAIAAHSTSLTLAPCSLPTALTASRSTARVQRADFAVPSSPCSAVVGLGGRPDDERGRVPDRAARRGELLAALRARPARDRAPQPREPLRELPPDEADVADPAAALRGRGVGHGGALVGAGRVVGEGVEEVVERDAVGEPVVDAHEHRGRRPRPHPPPRGSR